MDVSYPGAVAPERERFVSSLGLRLHVVEWGDPRRRRVLLTHGFYDHARSFDTFAPLLAARYRVLALDSRGHGDSDWPDGYAWLADVARRRERAPRPRPARAPRRATAAAAATRRTPPCSARTACAGS